jgi:hypothetical protein
MPKQDKIKLRISYLVNRLKSPNQERFEIQRSVILKSDVQGRILVYSLHIYILVKH